MKVNVINEKSCLGVLCGPLTHLLLPPLPHYRVLLVVPGCLEGRGGRGALEDPVVRGNCSELSLMQVSSELSLKNGMKIIKVKVLCPA